MSLEERIRTDRTWLASGSKQHTSEGPSSIVDVGTGRCVLFVPMLAELNVLYVPQMQAVISDGRRAIIYDPSTRTDKRLTVDDRVTELATTLDACGVDRCDLVSWSDTAAVAHRFASQQPGRVRTVTFVVSPARYRLPLGLRTLLIPLLRFPIERLIPTRIVASILGFYMSGPRIGARAIRDFAKEIPALAAVFKWSCWPCIEEHLVTRGSGMLSSLVVVGTRSKIVSPKDAEELHSALRTREPLALIKDGEHLATYANAGDVNTALLGFLSRCDASPKESYQ